MPAIQYFSASVDTWHANHHILLLPSTKEEVNAFACVHLSVCL